MKKENAGFVIFTSIVVVIISIFLSSLAIKNLWSWFIAGYFGIKQLTIPVALGISVLIGCFKGSSIKKEEDSNITEALFTAILTPLLSLGIGYIIHLFM